MKSKVFTLLKKDILLEYRQQHSFYGMLLYIASTLYVLFLTMDKPDAVTWNSLFWIIQLFICVNAVAKSFLQENKGRLLYFYQIASPIAFICSKILYNIFLMMIMSTISLALFYLFLSNPLTKSFLFFIIVLLGGSSISLVFTLTSAIAAKAQQNAALMAILGFPLILPQLLLLMKLSKTAFGEVFKPGMIGQLTAQIVGLDLLIFALALILFPYLWKD